MMGVLNPLWLALGAAVAVPILLHLFHRHHGPRVVFPALRYLRRAEKEHARRIRLRQLILLVLRAAVIVLAALAVSRPFVRDEAGSHEPTAVAIIVDNSLSSGLVTGDRRVLDELKERALETLSRAGPDDRFWLLQAGAPWEPALPGDAAQTAERVRRIEPTAAAAELDAAVARAAALLAAGAEGRAREIHVLTDLRAAAFRGGLEAANDAPPILVWHPAGPPPPNRAITDVEVGGGLPPRAGERSSVTAALSGPEGDEGGDSITVRLVVDGRVVAAPRAAPGGSVTIPFPARSEGLVTGWVEIDPDALRGDDRRYFVTRVQPPPRVAVTRGLAFIDDAVEVLAGAGRIALVGAGEAEIVLAPAGAGLGAIRDGRAGVVLPPDSPMELPAANQQLASAGVPWRFELPDTGGESRFLEEGADPDLLRALDGARVHRHYPLQPVGETGDAPPAGAVLLRLEDGSPWAVRGELPGGGRYVIVASPLTGDATTLPTSAAMLPLLDRMLGPWASAQPPRTEARPGERVALPAGARYVERPDGQRDPVAGSDAYLAAGPAGIYRVLGDQDRGLDAFAVNPPAAASALDRLDGRRLAAAFPGWTVRATSDADAWERTIFQQRRGREIWRPVLLLLLAALLLEGMVAAAGRGGRARESEAGPEPGRPVHAGARYPRRRTARARDGGLATTAGTAGGGRPATDRTA